MAVKPPKVQITKGRAWSAEIRNVPWPGRSVPAFPEGLERVEKMALSDQVLILRPSPDILDGLTRVAERLQISLEQAALEVLRSHVAQRSRAVLTPRQLMAVQAEAQARGHDWQQAELLERGLPLFWSESWLREQLTRGITLPMLSAIYGYRPRTLAQYAQKYGIVQREEAGVATYARARTLFEEGWSRQDIAAELGFSEPTIGLALAGEPSEKQRYLAQKLQAAGPYPANVEEVARRLFGGDTALARPWLYRMVKTGQLHRPARNVYTLPPSSNQLD